MLVFYYGTSVQQTDDAQIFRQDLAEKDQVKLDKVLRGVHAQIQPAGTDEIGIVSALTQEFTTVALHTFRLIQDRYPEIELRTMTVFLGHPDKYNPDKDRVIEILAVGESDVGRRSFPMEESFVGKTITDKSRRYCKDLDAKGKDCDPFFDPEYGKPGYKSLLCFPISDVSGVVGSVCLDSKRTNAFDGKENLIQQIIDEDEVGLAPAMQDLKKASSYIAYKLSPTPTPKGKSVGLRKK